MKHIKQLAQHISTTFWNESFCNVSVDKIVQCLESFKEPIDTPLIIGGKYVPISKSVGCSLEDCHVWNEVKDTDKPFLLMGFIKNDIVGLCQLMQGGYVYQFLTSDIIPYVELVK